MLAFCALPVVHVPYWNDPRMHNLGNTGLGGKLHAELAIFSTRLIDRLAYDNQDIRTDILAEYKEKSVIDFCCGVGLSTVEGGIGIDTSAEMIEVAKRSHPKSTFKVANAENFSNVECDIVTCMFAFHEMPTIAHETIIENAISICKEKVVIVDISPDYIPSATMLTGEPYLLDYLNNIRDTLLKYNFHEYVYIQNQVSIWTFTHSD